MKICKFGGSSLCNSTQINKVKDIVLSNNDRRIIVVSAPGKRFNNDMKITDMLSQIFNNHKENLSYDNLLQAVKLRYKEIIDNCKIDFDLDTEIKKIEENLLNDVNIDYIMSRGEYLNAKIFAIYIGFKFIDAYDLIFFEKNDRVNFNKTYEIIKEKINVNDHYVIGGFYGRNYNDEVKIFSRGGSDITGAILSAGLNADVYENWTDVSGILMADPNIVANPKTITNITYQQLKELTHMGAEVLHEDAIYPIKEKNIPLNIRNTNKPMDNGTMVCNNLEINENQNAEIITGISGKKNYTMISINNFDNTMENMKKLINILDENMILAENFISTSNNISIIIETKSIKNKKEMVLNTLTKAFENSNINYKEEISLISVVGKEMKNSLLISGLIIDTLSTENIDIQIFQQGCNSDKMMVCVGNSDFEKTIISIYNKAIHIA